MNATKSRRSSQVPGQYLGYSLQTTRAVMRLLAAEPGSFVSVEALDDVAQVGPAGNTTLEQTKSVGRTTNPIADRSPELRKTLANWFRAVKNGTVDAIRTHLELFVSKRRRGGLAESFHQAQTSAEASAHCL